MKNFIEKNGTVIAIVSAVVSFATITGAYVVSVIRDDKREIKRYKQIDEAHRTYIDCLNSLRDDDKAS